MHMVHVYTDLDLRVAGAEPGGPPERLRPPLLGAMAYGLAGTKGSPGGVYTLSSEVTKGIDLRMGPIHVCTNIAYT